MIPNGLDLKLENNPRYSGDELDALAVATLEQWRSREEVFLKWLAQTLQNEREKEKLEFAK